jgi:DNA-binding transcriptional LysR family regulator
MERDRWLGVELRHLAALEAVGRTRSFGGAARELGYTQSAVSQQIAQLERNVGQRLVDRPGGPRPVDLTDAGRLLLRHADAIVAQLDAAQADMAAFAEGAAGPLRVGIFQSVGARILPGLLRRFKKEWPRVEVSVREEIDAADLLRLLEHGELDLTFADMPLPVGPFESEQVLLDPYVLLVQAGSKLAERTSAPPFRELGGVPIVTWRHVGQPETYLRGRVPDLNIVFRSDDNGTLVGLVAEGLGVAVVPQLVVNPRNPAYVALPFGNRIPPRHLAIVWHRDRFRSAAAESFVELAKSLATEPSSASAASTSRRRDR